MPNLLKPISDSDLLLLKEIKPTLLSLNVREADSIASPLKNFGTKGLNNLIGSAREVNNSKKKIVVYIFRNKLTSECYVGSTGNAGLRIRTYLYPSALNKKRLINKALLEYGFNNFELSIYSLGDLSNPDLITRESARVLEQYLILTENSAYNEVKVAGSGKEFSNEAKFSRSKILSIPLFVYKITNNGSVDNAVLIYISNSYTKLAEELGISRSTISKTISNTDNLLYGQFKITKSLDSSVEKSLVTADQIKKLMAENRAKTRINNLKDFGKGKKVIITNLTDKSSYTAPNLITAVTYLKQQGVNITYNKLSRILANYDSGRWLKKEGFVVEKFTD